MSTATHDRIQESVEVGCTSLELVDGCSEDSRLILHGELEHPG